MKGKLNSGSGSRISVVVLTHRRPTEVLRTLARLVRLPERPPIIVVDNGSGDATGDEIRERFPQVRLVSLSGNAGAAGRNAGVAAADSPYVAFCDDDTWWEPGSLRHAADVLDSNPGVAVISARILVGADGREDPACRLMASSPLPREDLPGRAVLGFMAGACIFRRRAFLAAGGYEPRLFIGGEESLLALDLAAAGWRMIYSPQIVARHHPSPLRDTGLRRRLLARNAVWVAWMRRPWRSALSETLRAAADACREGQLVRLLRDAGPGIPWALANRRVIPAEVDALCRRVERQRHATGARPLRPFLRR